MASCILAASTASRWDFFPVHAASWWDSAVLGKQIEQTTPNLFSKNWLALTVPGAFSITFLGSSPPPPPPFGRRRSQMGPSAMDARSPLVVHSPRRLQLHHYLPLFSLLLRLRNHATRDPLTAWQPPRRRADANPSGSVASYTRRGRWQARTIPRCRNRRALEISEISG